MSHAPHDGLRGVVLYDGCQECENRVDKLWKLDQNNLQRLARLIYEGDENVSRADGKAMETLRLWARVVFASMITYQDSR